MAISTYYYPFCNVCLMFVQNDLKLSIVAVRVLVRIWYREIIYIDIDKYDLRSTFC